MDIVKEIKDILAHPKPHEKDRGLERMNDVFEYGYGYDLKKEDIVEGVKLLLAAALQEQEPMMKRKIFRTLFKAVVFRQGKYLRRSNVNWDLLVDSFSSLNKWQFGYALDILCITVFSSTSLTCRVIALPLYTSSASLQCPQALL